MSNSSETDWARVDALTDETIDTTDIPPLTSQYFARAVLRAPDGTMLLKIQVDPDVLAWFRSQGAECEPQINMALRRYMEAQSGTPRRNAS